ncbi:MAG: hypothetical protein V1736_05960 [Pseudomonadota bacterium]
MELLTETRKEFLEEMINISFGRAASSLAELLSVRVILDVPKVDEIKSSEIPSALEKQVGADMDITIVQQAFSGDFHGEVLLIIAADLGREAVKIITEESGVAPDLPLEELESEMLLEIGNIVIGACMGSFSDLLEKTVRFEVPNIILEKTPIGGLNSDVQNNRALIVLTQFQIGDERLKGFLFFLLNERWFDALYLAVDHFIESFAEQVS